MWLLGNWPDLALSASSLVRPRTTCLGNGVINNKLGPPTWNKNQDNLLQTGNYDLRNLSAETPFSGNVRPYQGES